MAHQGYYDSPSSEVTLSSQFHSVLTDSEFLLRAATTHDWDTLTAFCQYMEEIFTVSVPDRKLAWQTKRIEAAKQQLLAKDSWGNTALHAACYNLSPPRVVRALLQAASAAKPEPLQIHAILSRDHSTPLLVACATGASVEVIQALLDPPDGLTGAGAMVFYADQQGATPLTELAVHYELQRKSPMYVRTSLPLDQVRLIRYQTDNNNNNSNNRADALLDAFQSKLEALLQAAWSHCFPSQSMISMVHGLAHVAAVCPAVITRLVLREYPHMISFTNRQGTLPLHLTVSQPHTKCGTPRNITASLVRHAYCVQALLEAYPASAAMAVPTVYDDDQQQRPKRSPFLQAIAKGCLWHTTSMAAIKCSTGNNQGPLQHLWKAHPEDLSKIDPVTGMYPVILAATHYYYSSGGKTNRTEKKTQWEQQEHILQVDTIYNLLRLHPQILEEISV